MRFLLLGAALALALAASAAEPAFRPYHRPVLSWVPPYGTARVKTTLQDREEPGATLTHLGLQFWAPTAAGGLRYVTRYDKLSDDVVLAWRDWCHAHGLRALLCVYNGEEKWDWGLARDAFAAHREEFTAALLAEVERLALDGVDVDLEGNGSFDADRPAYVAFLKGLSESLHAQGRQLFVDSFAYLWNAPNQHWWPELFPLVDGLTTMGYEETGARSEGWRGYATQAAAAGKDAGKLLIGLPTHLDAWQETPLADHLQWFGKKDAPGIALWDAQFRAAGWKSPDLWQLLRKQP